MEIVELQEDFPLVTISHDRSTDKIHVTDIIADIEKTLGNEYKGDWDSQITREVGFLWEDVLSRAFGNKLALRPPEISLDDIAMSADGIYLPNWRVEEYKLTWKSARITPDMIWRWMAQVKSYCKGFNTNEVVFRNLYVNGNYKGSGPQYHAYLLNFTDMEIDENWQMLCNHAKYRGWI